MSQDIYINEQINSSKVLPDVLTKRPWANSQIPFACLVNGQPRSGKTKLIDWFVESFWKRYFTVIWIWCAGFESLYVCINKDCKHRWKSIIANNPDRKNELPACQCHDIIPCIWIVPYYFEIIQETLDRFNGVYWGSWEEYNEAYLSGNSLVDTWIPQTVDVTKIKKPLKLRPFPKMKIAKFHPPISDAVTKEFREEFYNIVKLSKNEHRLIVHTPESYTPDHKGKVERYSTVAGILDYIYDELADSELFERAKGNYDELPVKQQGQHKITLIATEFKKIAPSMEFMSEKEGSISRRAWYSFISEKRHKKTWIVCDTQADKDIYNKIRMQFSELKIFKRTTLSLIGDESKDFYNMVNNTCDNIYESWGFNPKRVPLHAKLRLLNERNMCRISELPDDRMIVKLETNEYMMRKVKHARFHHPDDKQDDFFAITGIKYKRNREIQKAEEEVQRPTKTFQKKKANEGVMLRIQQMVKEGKTFEQIRIELGRLEQDGTIPDMGYGNKEGKVINKRYHRWLDKQA